MGLRSALNSPSWHVYTSSGFGGLLGQPELNVHGLVPAQLHLPLETSDFLIQLWPQNSSPFKHSFQNSSYWRTHHPFSLFSSFFPIALFMAYHSMYFLRSFCFPTPECKLRGGRGLLCSVLCAQDLEPCLAHSRCSVNIR